MFAKLAQISLHGVGSARQVWATDEHRTGNRAACSSPIANSHRVRTPLLVCHWQQAPATGALNASGNRSQHPQPTNSRQSVCGAASPADRRSRRGQTTLQGRSSLNPRERNGRTP